MNQIIIRVRSLFLLSFALSLCGFVNALQAQHGSGGGGGLGGAVGSAGAVMKLPAKKVTRTTSTSPSSRTGTRPKPVDNSGQLEDALSLADDARQAERYESAERGYLLAAKLAPTDPRPYLGLGHTYYNQKKYAEAEKAYARQQA